jgi:hypothetical protein
MGETFTVDKNTGPKIHSIPVKEIQKYKAQKFLEESRKEEAQKELRSYLKEVCKEQAHTIGGLVKIARGFQNPPISDNLQEYLSSASDRALKSYIDNLIIESHGGDYSSFRLRENWVSFQKWDGMLFRKFFYYEDNAFVNIYRLSQTELLLLVNHPWSNKRDEEEYLNRMRDASTRLE